MEVAIPTAEEQQAQAPSPKGRPARYTSAFDWLWSGAEGEKWSLAAVLVAWTGLPFALWIAAIGAVVGLFAGIIGASEIGLAQDLHVQEGVGVIAAVAGAFVGAFWGLLAVYSNLVNDLPALFGALVSGYVVAALILLVVAYNEWRLLGLRGYRGPSRREWARLGPLYVETAERMELPVVPPIQIADTQRPAAWSHMRCIVISRSLLGSIDERQEPPRGSMDDDAIKAILAHELHHWDYAHPVGNQFLWACSWPIVLLFNIGTWLAGRGGFLTFLGWLLFWPAWLIVKLVLVPLTAQQSRQREFDADARAASLGDDYRVGLRKALAQLSAWEVGRTGWEAALTRTHPPTEVRLQQLEAPPG